VQDSRNRALGLSGEQAVVAREQAWLHDNGRADLAAAVRHVAVLEGDGAGYDVASFELDGSDRHIEVKTTKGAADADFLSANELEFSKRYAVSYYLYRVYDFDPGTGQGRYFVRHGSLAEGSPLQLEPIQFRARLLSGPS
jgi:hypothetical protein